MMNTEKTPGGILLDIEGTTSSISFVHDVMFPYAAENASSFLSEHVEEVAVQEAIDLMAVDAGHADARAWLGATDCDSLATLVLTEMRSLMQRDAKATGLKALQGLIWKGGFENGQLVAHTFPDVIPAITEWKEQGIDVRIYSSGSVSAQKLFFGHLQDHGDCLHLFSGHYDTKIGGKKESASYERIASDWGLPADSILFVSDIPEELTAAESAGLQTRLSVRPGNHPVSDPGRFDSIQSFEEI